MHRPWPRLIVVLIAVALVFAHPTSAPASAPQVAGTLDRDADPVITLGSAMPGFLGAPLSELFVYALRDSQWQQIPWQFDEVKDGEYTASDNGLLDAADELVVMGQDCGDRAAVDDWIGDVGAASHQRYEITVTDPLDTSKRAWLYVYRSATLTETVTEDYVSFDYLTSVFTTPVYILGFFPNYLGGNRLEMNGSGVNVLDRSKFRLKVPGQHVVTEDAIELDEPQPVILDGRVRAIAGYQGFGQGILTVAYRSQFYDLLTIDFSWSPLPFEWASASADFNENIADGVYYDSNTPTGVAVDGSPDVVTTSPASPWQQISSDTGTVLHAYDASPMQGTRSTYYRDDSTYDASDTGDHKSYGDMGVVVTNPLKLVDLEVTHYILPPNLPSVGATYYDCFANPLQSATSEQWNSAQPVLSVSPATVTILTSSGLSPRLREITVANNGSGTLAWTASAQAAWLQIAPSSGTVNGGSSRTIQLSVNPGSVGVFEEDVTISAGAGSLGSPQTVHVVLVNLPDLSRHFFPYTFRD